MAGAVKLISLLVFQIKKLQKKKKLIVAFLCSNKSALKKKISYFTNFLFLQQFPDLKQKVGFVRTWVFETFPALRDAKKP